MNISDIIMFYLAIGVVVIALEWLLLCFFKEGIFEHRNPLCLKIEVFIFETMIWPRQLGIFLIGMWYVLEERFKGG